MYHYEEIQSKLAARTRQEYDAIDALNQTAAKEGNIVETKSPGFIEDLGNGVEKHDLKFRVQPTAKEGKQS